MKISTRGLPFRVRFYVKSLNSLRLIEFFSVTPTLQRGGGVKQKHDLWKNQGSVRVGGLSLKLITVSSGDSVRWYDGKPRYCPIWHERPSRSVPAVINQTTKELFGALSLPEMSKGSGSYPPPLLPLPLALRGSPFNY